MGIKNIRLDIAYWAFNDEDSNLVVDGVVSGVLEARATAQLVLMHNGEGMPPPRVKLMIDIDGVMTPIDPDTWKLARDEEKEERADDGNS